MSGKGLGRGLGSLFGEMDDFEKIITNEKTLPVKTENKKTTVEDNSAVAQSTEIEISLIDPNLNQPRKRFDEKSLNELANSIRTHGIIQPLILNKNGNRYLIIAGERRFRASKLCGLKTVPAIIKNYSEKEVQEIALIENLQREDLNPIESAEAVNELMIKYNMTQEKIAERIGRSRASIANSLRLLSLPKEVIEMVKENKLSGSHARTLCGLTDAKKQLELANLVVKSNISVHELEKAIKAFQKNNKEKSSRLEPSIELKDFINNMQNLFATKVTVLGNDRKGRIYIDYYNSDDLQRIYEIIHKINK